MPALVTIAGIYLALLFLIAWAIGREPSVAGFVRHPLVYTLALGVYASSWSYFGSVGYAKNHGLLFLGTHIGKMLSIILCPAVWGRVLALTRDHQLTSVADLFAFRYRSRTAGFLVTLVSLVASLPYLAQQVRAVVDSLGAVTGSRGSSLIGLGFCGALALFAILFGTRDVLPRVQSDGLTAALAFESVVKLSALLAVGVSAIAGFGGLGGLDAWLTAHPEATRAIHLHAQDGGSWVSLVMLSFGTAFLLPRQFHIAFAEGTKTRSLRVASWAFPLYHFLLNLPVLPILWAALSARSAGDPDLYVITVAHASGSPSLTAFAFLGGVSASSAMVLVTFLAMSAMCLNYFVSPFVLLVRPAAPERDLRRWLLWARRALIVVLAAASWGTYELLKSDRSLIEWGIGSFVAFAQFFPGLVGVLFWRRATARGVVVGIVAGIAVWIPTSFIPLFRAAPMASPLASVDPLTFATFVSLSLNALVFGVVSLLLGPRPGEEDAAAICVGGAAATPTAPARSPDELRERLARFLGARLAADETERAVRQIGLSVGNTGPLSLRRLGERVEQNLSGMMGPLLARLVVRESSHTDVGAPPALDEQLRALDEQLALGGPRLHGVAAELDTVRRFLGALLDDLPLGVCALDHAGRIVLCNRSLERLTGVAPGATEGTMLIDLPSPWGQALGAIVASAERADQETALPLFGAPRVLRVQCSKVAIPSAGGASDAAEQTGLVMLVEDCTERRALETKLTRQDRLASIGRLAAGAAHEIRNPLTNILAILRRRGGGDTAEGRDIVEQVERGDAILRALLSFSRVGPLTGPAPTSASVALRGLVEEAVLFIRIDRFAQGLFWDNRCDERHTVFGNRQQLQQVLVNLLTNAADASPKGASVIVESAADGKCVVLRVLDEGPGLAPEVAERLFEPFVTTKDVHRGTGLGLYIAYGIVSDHHGTIAIDRDGEKRTVVSVKLPAGESA